MEDNTVKNEGAEKTFTQDEVNGIVKERLDRAEKKWEEKYANYSSPDDITSKTEELNNKITELGSLLDSAKEKAGSDAQALADKDQAISDLEAKIKAYETDSVKTRIALEIGIPYELKDKLSGTTEEEIRKDAEKLLPFVSAKATMPLRNPDSNPEVNGVKQAFMKMNPNLKIN